VRDRFAETLRAEAHSKFRALIGPSDSTRWVSYPGVAWNHRFRGNVSILAEQEGKEGITGKRRTSQKRKCTFRCQYLQRVSFRPPFTFLSNTLRFTYLPSFVSFSEQRTNSSVSFPFFSIQSNVDLLYFVMRFRARLNISYLDLIILSSLAFIFSLRDPHHRERSWKRFALDITTCRAANTKILQIGAVGLRGFIAVIRPRSRTGDLYFSTKNARWTGYVAIFEVLIIQISHRITRVNVIR